MTNFELLNTDVWGLVLTIVDELTIFAVGNLLLVTIIDQLQCDPISIEKQLINLLDKSAPVMTQAHL